MLDQLLIIILVAIVLGADAFSLSLGMGIRGVSKSYELKFALMVMIFHVLMPLIGLNLGLTAGKFLGVWASRLGALILAYIAIDMFIKAYRESRPHSYKFNQASSLLNTPTADEPSGWLSLILLTTSVSIDALTVGFSLGTFKMPVFYTVTIMGLVAGSMTYLGFKGGSIVGRIMGSYAQAAGGIVLLGLAAKLVFQI